MRVSSPAGVDSDQQVLIHPQVGVHIQQVPQPQPPQPLQPLQPQPKQRLKNAHLQCTWNAHLPKPRKPAAQPRKPAAQPRKPAAQPRAAQPPPPQPRAAQPPPPQPRANFNIWPSEVCSPFSLSNVKNVDKLVSKISSSPRNS